MRNFLCMMAKKCEEKSSLGIRGKNGEKPKILINESVKIGVHSTVFSAVNHQSPNLSATQLYTLLRVSFCPSVCLLVGRILLFYDFFYITAPAQMLL